MTAMAMLSGFSFVVLTISIKSHQEGETLKMSFSKTNLSVTSKNDVNIRLLKPFLIEQLCNCEQLYYWSKR